MKRQLSIVVFFASLGTVILVMIFAAIGMMTYGLSAQNKLQANFINRTSTADTILANLYEMEECFESVQRGQESENGVSYQESCDRLEANLSYYKTLCADSQTTLDYVRRLHNFNLYQQKQLLEVKNGILEGYRVFLYISRGLDLHQQQTLEMAQTDMLLARGAYEKASEQLSRRIFTVMLVLAAGAVLTGAMMIRFYLDIKMILHHMVLYFRKLGKCDWDAPDLQTSRYREFDLISQTANHMKLTIKDFIREIQRQSELEKQLNEERLINEQQHNKLISAQLSALRAQVNPHFLFNALNMIGITALVGKSETVMQLVEATGKILRYSLYHQKALTPLKEELEIVEQYLFLQKCRFKEAVESEIHNDLDEEEILIPTMSVQPIVENCFKHGFGNKKRLHIHISITGEEELISICVRDDGVGFASDADARTENSGIGLNNIRERLELMYGAGQAELRIESELDVYSSVTLTIPRRETA
ncbi:MAG: histidine kinase [Lachnospiraceae bacterium]|nr:histidine kinase [Lachnospiraceae bacterium]